MAHGPTLSGLRTATGGLGGGGGGATAATLALNDATVKAAAVNKEVKVTNLRIQVSPTITALPSMPC